MFLCFPLSLNLFVGRNGNGAELRGQNLVVEPSKPPRDPSSRFNNRNQSYASPTATAAMVPLQQPQQPQQPPLYYYGGTPTAPLHLLQVQDPHRDVRDVPRNRHHSRRHHNYSRSPSQSPRSEPRYRSRSRERREMANKKDPYQFGIWVRPFSFIPISLSFLLFCADCPFPFFPSLFRFFFFSHIAAVSTGVRSREGDDPVATHKVCRGVGRKKTSVAGASRPVPGRPRRRKKGPTPPTAHPSTLPLCFLTSPSLFLTSPSLFCNLCLFVL